VKLHYNHCRVWVEMNITTIWLCLRAIRMRLDREMQKMGTRRLGRCDRTWIFPMYDASPNQIWCTVKRQGRTQKHSGDFRCVGFELDVVVTFGMDWY